MEYRIQIEKRVCMPWVRRVCLENLKSSSIDLLRKMENCWSVCLMSMSEPGEPEAVVLQGAARAGKTPLVRKALMDWAPGSLCQQRFTEGFYLCMR